MNKKVTYALLITLGLIVVVLSLFSYNLNTIVQDLTNQNTSLRSKLNQPVLDNSPVSSSVSGQITTYDYVYNIVKNLYPWEGKPTPTYFDWLGSNTHQSVFGYRLASGKIGDSLQDALVNISAALHDNGWTDSQTEVADGVDGHVRGFEKGSKKLVFSVNDFSASLGEPESRYIVLSFEPSSN